MRRIPIVPLAALLLVGCQDIPTQPESSVALLSVVLDLTATDLGTLGGTSSQAFGINDHGQVVGQSRLANGQLRAFLWEDGAMTDLGTLGGTFSLARGINDLGQVVGRSTLANGESRATLWSRMGRARTRPPRARPTP